MAFNYTRDTDRNTGTTSTVGEEAGRQYTSLLDPQETSDGGSGSTTSAAAAAAKKDGSGMTAWSLLQHSVDWLLLLLLVAMDVVLYFFVDPFARFVNKTMLYTDNLMFPLKSDTVPFWSVPIISAVVPAVIMLIWPRLARHQRLALLRGVLFAVLLAGVLTDALKLAIGRPRPNFFWRCFPNGEESYDETTGEVLCNGLTSVVQEGHKSFPSGHASWSFAGLGFFSLFLNQMLNISRRHGNDVLKLVLIVSPLFVAVAVSITRVNDYMHHWQDVSVGGIIGLIAAKYSFSKLCLEPSSQALHHV